MSSGGADAITHAFAPALPCPAAAEGAKRKREEDQAAAPRRMSGSRGPSADKALAAAAAQGSAERPSKVARSGSGFSLSNAGESRGCQCRSSPPAGRGIV